MEPSSCALFLTEHFIFFICHSIGYIHWNWTGPASFISWGTWMTKWTITMKNEGENICSNLERVNLISFYNWYTTSNFTIREHKFLKNKLNSINVYILLGPICHVSSLVTIVTTVRENCGFLTNKLTFFDIYTPKYVSSIPVWELPTLQPLTTLYSFFFHQCEWRMRHDLMLTLNL